MEIVRRLRALRSAMEEFAGRHHMGFSAKGWMGPFTLNCKYRLVRRIVIRRVGEYLAVESCFAIPAKTTCKNLHWVNRLNARLPNVRLAIDGGLKFVQFVKLEDLDLSSGENLDGALLGGMLWLVVHGEDVGNFLVGKMSETTSCNAILDDHR